MKLGDMVTIKIRHAGEFNSRPHDLSGTSWPSAPSSSHYINSKTGNTAIGIIIDCLENDHGFTDYEILLDNETMWFSDIQLEVVNEH